MTVWAATSVNSPLCHASTCFRIGSGGIRGCGIFRSQVHAVELKLNSDHTHIVGCVSSNCADKLKVLRGHGAKPKYYHRVVGGNFRLDAIHAAVVSAKLPHLDSWTAGRQHNAKRYDQLFHEAELPITLPVVNTDRHIFNQYVIRSASRDQLQASLQKKGVGSEVYYPVPMHLQDCFAYLGIKPGAFPESERAAKESLAIPVYPELSDAQARYMVDTIAEFVGQTASVPGKLARA